MQHQELFKAWLNSSLLTPQEKQELLNYSEDKKKNLFNNQKLTLGTSGIRLLVGLFPQGFNRFTCRLIAKTYANYLKTKHKNPRVLVVHDNRKQGYEFHIEVASILSQEGIKVFLINPSGILSTPIVSYLIIRKKLHGALNITASHNPRTYNGIKIFDSKGKQIEGQEEKLFAAMLPETKSSITFSPKELNYSNVQFISEEELQEFFNELIKNIPSALDIANQKIKKNIRILFDGHSGSTKGNISKLAHALGFTNFSEFHQTQENLVNPEEEASLHHLIKEANNRSIDYVFAADLDGDRAIMAEKQDNGEWYVFNGNEIGILIAKFKNQFQPSPNSFIVSSMVTNTLIDQLFPNIEIHRTNTGFKNISKKIEDLENKGKNLLIAFEEATGSLMIPIHKEKDGYQQIGYLLEIIAWQKSQETKLKKYLDSLTYINSKYWRGFTTFQMTSKVNMKKLNNLKTAQTIIQDTKFKVTSIQSHGEILEWQLQEKSWIKFRYSGTEPKLKIYFNIFWNNREELEKYTQKIKGKISELLI